MGLEDYGRLTNTNVQRLGERSGGRSPLLELFGGNQSGPQVTVPHPLRLPPRGVVLCHDLQDVPSFKGKPRLLAGRGLVFQGDVVEQSSHVNLRRNIV